MSTHPAEDSRKQAAAAEEDIAQGSPEEDNQGGNPHTWGPTSSLRKRTDPVQIRKVAESNKLQPKD